MVNRLTNKDHVFGNQLSKLLGYFGKDKGGGLLQRFVVSGEWTKITDHVDIQR